MAVELTPLGFKKPDGKEAIRNGDNVISDNAQKADELLLEARARLANLQADKFSRSIDGGNASSDFDAEGGAAADPLELNDSAVAQAVSGGVETPVAIQALVGDYLTGGDLEPLQDQIDGKQPVVRTLAELTAAVTAGGIVHVGAASITLTAPVQVTVPVRIVGGSFVLPANAAYPAFDVTTSDVSFSGCTFTGAGTAADYDINSRFIYAHGSSSAYLDNIHVRGCTMTGNQTENIRFSYVRDFTVTDNLMDDFLYAGFLGISVEDGTVANNVVSNAVMKAPVVNVYGIAITDTVNTEAGRSRRVKVIGNTVRNIPWEGIDTHGGEQLVIAGNTVMSCVRGIALVSGNETRLTVPEDCVVSGNYVDRGTATGTEREGISLFGLLNNAASGVITGNMVKGYSASKAIYVSQEDPLRTLVEGNSHPHIPWTNMSMNTASWTAHGTYPPQYMVDGRTVYLRGLATSATSSVDDSVIATLPEICKPGRRTFAGSSLGAHASAGRGTLAVYATTGELWMLYRTGSDFYSYPVESSYQRNYTG